ncbi:dolichol-phosphate mannosyltransferase [Geodermatophilus telluris]|uniref:Dolichol-phosphate mannosyltransferase n=1 Tax=Geodermatophilus telluris TaxID=1190417 RepID=A0A1G6IKI4_9ACTN|nr:glycosyltransferase family 2 protein [Geodermatophilus telluris]SDC07027.1 dolichol-phosphate mannosyltransferase [Geodermatophilus telluris]
MTATVDDGILLDAAALEPAAAAPSRSTISYVFPVFNEEGNLRLLMERITEVTDSLVPRYDVEFVFVNDGSTDRSAHVLAQLADEDDRVVVLDFARNYGHQMAVTAGLDAAVGDAVIIMDSDLQDPPQVSLELIQRWEDGADVVYAQRRSRRDSAFKRATASGYYWVLSKLASIEIPRNTGDFRLVSRAVVDELGKYREHNRFMRGLVSYVGFRQESVLFDRDARHSGETGYPLSKMIRFAADGILGFSVTPLRLINRVGVAISVLSLLGFLYVAGVKVLDPESSVPGWAFLGTGIFFLGGIQLLMLGVLGAYIGRIYTEVQGRPLYAVRSVRRSRRESVPAVLRADRLGR